MAAHARQKKSAAASCAPFCSMQLYFCWVMICPSTTSGPTQTQGHTHHDTVESVWLGSRSTHKGGGGEKAQNVTDVFVLIAAVLLLLFFRLSVHYQLVSLSLSLSVTSPCLSICHYPHSQLLLPVGSLSLHALCNPGVFLMKLHKRKFQFKISWEFLLCAWTNLTTLRCLKYSCLLYRQGVHLCKARCVGSTLVGRRGGQARERGCVTQHFILIISTSFISCPYWPVGRAAVAHS